MLQKVRQRFLGMVTDAVPLWMLHTCSQLDFVISMDDITNATRQPFLMNEHI